MSACIVCQSSSTVVVSGPFFFCLVCGLFEKTKKQKQNKTETKRTKKKKHYTLSRKKQHIPKHLPGK
jgi:hypothetical protein